MATLKQCAECKSVRPQLGGPAQGSSNFGTESLCAKRVGNRLRQNFRRNQDSHTGKGQSSLVTEASAAAHSVPTGCDPFNISPPSPESAKAVRKMTSHDQPRHNDIAPTIFDQLPQNDLGGYFVGGLPYPSYLKSIQQMLLAWCV
ncbi:hypothetical protein GJ744_006178 [Endocarpon pusillum]|uniref:Uncharacterized protein n=1 Tax=Endocarpon pusillum TaxID=364733 RepID=A0A8H7A6X6_9EURO|nr:hypothetical protein GJ744_006178 [Endocarpon pusillum]